MSNQNKGKNEEMKRVVIEALTEEFKKTSSQDHADLSIFSKGLEEGRELELTVLTGGLCNFSYKLQFKNSDVKNDVSLFVKLTFGSPILFPDVPCDSGRTQCEFKMMELFKKTTPYPESAVTPYLYFELEGGEEEMKVIVTEFSSRLEEQAANIFVDGGSIDKLYAINIAKSLSSLHNREVTEPDFNEGMKEFFVTMTNSYAIFFAGFLDETNEQPDRTAQRARAIGKDALDEIMNNICKNLLRTDCYVHGDCHMFNMLVEGSLKAAANEDQNRIGDVAIIDWEFTHCGPIGKDIGWVQVFPIACALAHAINGDESSSKSILEFCDTLWESYSASIDLDGKELSIVDVYRQTIGYLGCMLFAYAAFGLHVEYLPIEEGNTEDLNKVKESLGVLAFGCYEIGWLGIPDGATLEELQKRFKDSVEKELQHLAPTKSRRSGRRSSLLRTTGRRISDAHSYFSMATDVESTMASSHASEEFKADASEVMKRVSFGEEEEDEEESEDLFPSEFPNLPAAFARKRRSRISVMPRTSLALTDLKRKSVCEWDRIIVDFDF